MAITINGAGTITGISAGGLPDGVIVNDDIANTTITDAKLHTSLDFSGHTVTGLPAGGKILKVESTPMSVATGISGSSYSTYTDSGVTATFTPTAATSKVFINLSLFTHCDQLSSMIHVDFYYRLMASIGGAAYTELEEYRSLIRAYTNTGTAQWGGHTFIPYLHTPNTTSAITYKIQFKNTTGGYHSWFTDKTHIWNFLEVGA